MGHDLRIVVFRRFAISNSDAGVTWQEAAMGRKTNSIIGTVLMWSFTFFLSGYFVLHALGLGGEHGYFSLEQIDGEIAQAEEQLAELTEYRDWLNHRVNLVSEDRVDADLLGELARNNGGLYAADEIIININ
jgi:cell division protein FtsB|tara:strand:+ start:5895 stop:6290 length:396 start_codon:yes stop_codon:yes gene_type:complete